MLFVIDPPTRIYGGVRKSWINESKACVKTSVGKHIASERTKATGKRIGKMKRGNTEKNRVVKLAVVVLVKKKNTRLNIKALQTQNDYHHRIRSLTGTCKLWV